MKYMRIFIVIGVVVLAGLGFQFFTSDSVSGQETAAAGAPAGEGVAWNIRCDEDEQGNQTHCEMFQRLTMKDTGQRLAEFAIGFPKDEDGKKLARGIVILPLGIMLPSGVEMSVDDGESYKFDIRFCTGQGCFAFVDLNDQLFEKFRTGSNATFKFGTQDGKTAAIPMTLEGFSEAFEKLS